MLTLTYQVVLFKTFSQPTLSLLASLGGSCCEAVCLLIAALRVLQVDKIKSSYRIVVSAEETSSESFMTSGTPVETTKFNILKRVYLVNVQAILANFESPESICTSGKGS